MNGSVVHHGDLLRRAQARQRHLQFERLFDRLVDELLDDFFAPCIQLPPAETAAESLHTGETDAFDLMRPAIEHGHAGVGQDLHNVLRLARFEIVIAQDADGRDAKRRRDFFGQDLRFLDQAVVGEIAAKKENVGLRRYGGEKRLQTLLPRLLDVNVGDGGDAQVLFHFVPSTSMPAVQRAISSAVILPIGSSRASL